MPAQGIGQIHLHEGMGRGLRHRKADELFRQRRVLRPQCHKPAQMQGVRVIGRRAANVIEELARAFQIPRIELGGGLAQRGLDLIGAERGAFRRRFRR